MAVYILSVRTVKNIIIVSIHYTEFIYFIISCRPSEENERIGPKVPQHPSVADIIRSAPHPPQAAIPPPPVPMMSAPPPPPPAMPPTGPPKFMGKTQ